MPTVEHNTLVPLADHCRCQRLSTTHLCHWLSTTHLCHWLSTAQLVPLVAKTAWGHTSLWREWWACHSYMVPHLFVARVHGVSGMVSQGRPPQRSASPDTLLLSFAISQQTCATINRVWRHKKSLACWAGLAGHTTRSTVPCMASLSLATHAP